MWIADLLLEVYSRVQPIFRERIMVCCRCLVALLVASLVCVNDSPAKDNPAPNQKGTQQLEKTRDAHAEHSDMVMNCAKACSDCQLACDSCSAHCLSLLAVGKTQHAKTMQLCNDCAAICAASAQIVARHGPLTNVICTACADACNQCAVACEAMKDDAHMKHCAAECRRCEKACRNMTAQATEHKH
jgi:hypothetical protein